ncbi:hypothetical protein RUND412_009964 [Rhizina undulata]
MASNPPGKCCAKGSIHEGTPKGEIKEIAGVEAYFSYPPSGSNDKVVYFLTDVIGHKFVNAQLIADQFAAHGYLTIMPDLFQGDPILLPESIRPAGWDFHEWLSRHSPEVAQPVVDKVLAAIKSEIKPKKIGAVGYCYGGKYVIRLLNGDIDAGYTAHPSFATIEEVAAIKAPLAISAAETDTIFPAELRRQTEDKLKEVGATYQLTLFSGVEHGFAVRADVSKKLERFGKEQAFGQAVTWFGEFLQ